MTKSISNSVNTEGNFTFIPWEEQTIANDFMFSKVMSNPELSKELLRRILPHLNIQEVKDIEIQKTLKNYYLHKGVRLDVYVTDDKGRIYDIEMQMAEQRAQGRERSATYRQLIANRMLVRAIIERLRDAGL